MFVLTDVFLLFFFSDQRQNFDWGKCALKHKLHLNSQLTRFSILVFFKLISSRTFECCRVVFLFTVFFFFLIVFLMKGFSKLRCSSTFCPSKDSMHGSISSIVNLLETLRYILFSLHV